MVPGVAEMVFSSASAEVIGALARERLHVSPFFFFAPQSAFLVRCSLVWATSSEFDGDLQLLRDLAVQG